MPTEPADSAPSLGSWRAAAAVTAVHAVGLLVVAVDAVIGMGGSADRGRALSFALTVVVLAACAGALAWALAGQRAFARTPTLLWHGFALLAAFTLTTSGAPALGILIGLTALLGLVLALRLPRPQL
ncbi:hypothetical protein G9U51_01885 [Calidifontibacter sp. DB0510]|uniref:Uncharacterized protein n=1 Tax=Metallococcus carri TaxID=1656884 RepID=A0A967E959_9MICO|nr:hypothetical protein [Metallococcus carri]NHN54529.1 hypothetical protein [Metallococcus carri]NOP36632.1 hypothetical protein [Calidifontibacter sp. DB2511S]